MHHMVRQMAANPVPGKPRRPEVGTSTSGGGIADVRDKPLEMKAAWECPQDMLEAVPFQVQTNLTDQATGTSLAIGTMARGIRFAEPLRLASVLRALSETGPEASQVAARQQMSVAAGRAVRDLQDPDDRRCLHAVAGDLPAPVPG
jgi:hypothetical protein